jgi:hypothetical protein
MLRFLSVRLLWSTRRYSVFGERHLANDYSTHARFLTIYELSRLPWLGAMILISC